MRGFGGIDGAGGVASGEDEVAYLLLPIPSIPSMPSLPSIPTNPSLLAFSLVVINRAAGFDVEVLVDFYAHQPLLFLSNPIYLPSIPFKIKQGTHTIALLTIPRHGMRIGVIVVILTFLCLEVSSSSLSQSPQNFPARSSSAEQGYHRTVQQPASSKLTQAIAPMQT